MMVSSSSVIPTSSSGSTIVRMMLLTMIVVIDNVDCVKLLPRSIVKTANDITRANPKLRAKDMERKRRLQEKLASMVVSSPSRMKMQLVAPSSRRLEDGADDGDDAGEGGGAENEENDDANNQDAENENYKGNNYYDNYYNNNNNYYNNNNNNQNGNGNGNNDNFGYYWNQYMNEQQIGFDINNYAIKYTGCSTVQTFSDELAEDQDAYSVLQAERFATFRLCPLGSCSSGSRNGCSSNYGDYVVSLDQYLVAIYELETERVSGFCEYCQGCASLEAAKSFYTDVNREREAALEYVQDNYLEWYKSYMQQKSNQYGQNNQYNYNNQYNNQYQNSNQNYNYQYMAQYDKTAAMIYYDALRNGYINYDNSNQYNNNDDFGWKYGAGYGNNDDNNNNNNNNNYNNYLYNQYNNNNNMYAPYAVNPNAWMNKDYWSTKKRSYSYSGDDDTGKSFSPDGTFFGQTLFNGYYDQNGDFYLGWGYFNYKGQYLSIEDDEIEWDQGLWGEQPEGWDVAADGNDADSCSYKFSGQCYGQYDSCFEILMQNYEQENGGGYDYQQQQEQAEFQEFLECTELDINNNNLQAYQNYYAQQYANKQQYENNQCYDGDEGCEQYMQYQEQMYEQKKLYIGPHCDNNGHDISLAVYNDEYCTIQDETISVDDIMGYTVIDATIDLVPEDCYPCGVGLWDFVWYGEEEGDYEDQADSTQPMCSMLYQLSGKCNKNLEATEFSRQQYYNNNNGYYNYQNNNNNNNEADEEQQQAYNNQWKQMYQSWEQEQNEDAVCSFINSLKSQSYDETGRVKTAEINWFDYHDWNNEIQMESSRLSWLQKAAIILLSIGCGFMTIWACILNGMLSRKTIPWRPRRTKGEDATDIARQNSGIVMGRSRSGPGSAPLI